MFRFLMCCLALKVGLDIFLTVNAGEIYDKYGNASSFQEHPIRFLAHISQDIAILLFAIYLATKGSKLRE